MINYFDNAATTKPDPEVVKAMMPYFTKLYGNPSSNNPCGVKIRQAVEEARCLVSEYLGCVPPEIIFTSGATEANNLAIKGCADLCGNEKFHFILSCIEHKSVLSLKECLECAGHEVDLVNCNPNGVIDLEDLENLIQENTLLISCIYVNNETGIIQPISKIAKICRDNDILFHVDATQAFGKLKIKVREIGIDLLSFSGHKFHGPKGVGGLYKAHDLDLKCQILGGSQESSYRSGTENVPGIIGLGKAIEIANENLGKNYIYLEELSEYFLDKLNKSKIEYILNGDLCCKVPWIFNIALLNSTASHLISNMKNFCFSRSSACSKGNKPSYVLKEMCIDDDLIKKSIRVSFSKFTTKEQINKFVESLKKLIND